MPKSFEIIIIGGGFSGIISAIQLAEGTNKSILLLERNDRLCKKIPSTGNGRGNLTNADLSSEYYHGNKEFVKYAIRRYDNNNLIGYFNDLGVACVEEDGKIYPASMQASSVSDMLRYKAESLNFSIRLGYMVNAVKKTNGGYLINDEYFCKRLVICAGGQSMKNFGTDGKGYSLCRDLGLKVTNVYPSLVQIKTQTDKIKGLKGIKQNASVTLLDGDKRVATFTGDLLFTDFGVSGDSVFRLSAYLSEVKTPKLKISFLPNLSQEDLTEFLVQKASKPYMKNAYLSVGVVQNKLGLQLLKICQINGEEKSSQSSAKRLANEIKNFTLAVTGTLGFDYSQVTHGGVDSLMVDNTTMKYKGENIYLAGEILNIDGDCGGYNLQWAYSSARVLAEAIINDCKQS